MQQLTEQIIRLSPPGGLFDHTVVGNLFADASVGARKQLIHRATRAGEILRLKRGLFILDKVFRKSELHPFALAAVLHAPSHISLETALWYHGLIPEAVYQISSVTTARSQTVSTPLGVFSFDRVPSPYPRAGVEATPLEGGEWAFIASPLRAIADAVYLHREISWKRDGLSYCTESLRIEEDDLAQISFAHSEEICAAVCNRRTRAYLEGLEKAVNHVS